MIPLESVDHDTFSPLTGRTFATMIGETQLELELSEVKMLGHKRSEASRDPFSLLFRSPQELRLPQGIYCFECEALGEIELFITQVGRGAQGSEFEAIFT